MIKEPLPGREPGKRHRFDYEYVRNGTANVFMFDGTLIRIAAQVNVHTKYVEEMHQFYPRPPSRDSASSSR